MISIVIPALNEAGGIAGTIDSLQQVLAHSPEAGAEILVVDDGSSDATARIAAEAGATVVRHPHNVGYGQALKSGIRAARHDTIVIIDADLTYPAQSIPELVAEFRKGFDMVVGARTGHHYTGSVFKGPLRDILKFLVEFSAGRSIPDANSGLRVFSRATISGYLPHLCNTFSFTTSLTLAYMLTGRFVTYLPIPYHERVGKTKVKLLKDSLLTLQYIIQAIIYYNPLKLFLLLTLITIALAIGGFLAAAITGLHAPYLLGIGGLLMSIAVFALGLLADLLRQILVRTGAE
ncbi:glycosyltransferase family 2 protein [Lamprocystis purpurea]|jgi:glycosyltransferase involved in cell wall biosynthesis|uniref:glycosyltransferase family 2 protein n=1 Tax=Lamprocystis purpurea TaxID=61598 RepID=UPI000376BEAC|nr:glycosyltransferase family 2 protein [Lamprocystis purpurea]